MSPQVHSKPATLSDPQARRAADAAHVPGGEVVNPDTPRATWSALYAAGELGVARTLSDGDYVCRRDQPVDVAWVAVRGQLEVFQTSDNERSYLARIVRAPTLLCLKECLAGETSCLQTVRVLESAELVAMPRAAELALLRNNPDLCLNTLVEVCRTFCGAVRLESNRMHLAESLLANVMLAYATACGEPWDGGTRLRVKRTQLDLANAIGSNERTVNRVLTAWKEAGFTDRRDARHLILRRERLEALVEPGSRTLVHQGRA